MIDIGFFDLVAAIFFHHFLSFGALVARDQYQKAETRKFLAECDKMDQRLNAKIERVK